MYYTSLKLHRVVPKDIHANALVRIRLVCSMLLQEKAVFVWANSSVAFITPPGISYLTGNKVKGTLKIRCQFLPGLYLPQVQVRGIGLSLHGVVPSLLQWRDLYAHAVVMLQSNQIGQPSLETELSCRIHEAEIYQYPVFSANIMHLSMLPALSLKSLFLTQKTWKYP